MDEFMQADLDDYLLDRADEYELRTQIWDDLHGEYRDFVDFYEACARPGPGPCPSVKGVAMTDDDLGPLLIASIEAIHKEKTRRPIHCMNCGLVFLKADAYFKHRAHAHTHPSRGGAA